jgi:hypothetical protein
LLDSTTRGVRILTASGDDTVVAGLTSISGRLDVNLSGGDDSMSFSGPTTATTAQMNGSGGDDTFQFGFFLTANSINAQNFEITI